MAINLIITDAGRALLVNASNAGTNPVTLSHVGFGTGKAVSNAAQSALQAEFTRLNTVAGSAVANDTLHVMISDDTTASYSFSEFGLFTSTGVLFAVYSQATNIMNKTSVASLRLAVDIVLEPLDAVQVAFGDTNFLNPPATTVTAGVAKIAFQSDTVAGTDNQKIITPLRLQHKVNQLLGGVSASFNTFKKIEAALQQSTALKKGTAKIATQSLTGTGVDNQSIITPLLLKWRVNQLLDGVGASFNTLKKIATVLVGKLGKTETAVNSFKLNHATEATTAHANTIAKRDSVADISARSLRTHLGNYATVIPLSSAIGIRHSLSDNYSRYYTLAAFKTYFGKAKDSEKLDGKAPSTDKTGNTVVLRDVNGVTQLYTLGTGIPVSSSVNPNQIEFATRGNATTNNALKFITKDLLNQVLGKLYLVTGNIRVYQSLGTFPLNFNTPVTRVKLVFKDAGTVRVGLHSSGRVHSLLFLNGVIFRSRGFTNSTVNLYNELTLPPNSIIEYKTAKPSSSPPGVSSISINCSKPYMASLIGVELE